MEKRLVVVLAAAVMLAAAVFAPRFASARLDPPARLAGFFEDLLEWFRVPAIEGIPPAAETRPSESAESEKERGAPLPDRQAGVPLYKPVLDYEEAVIAAVEAASPSVVSIVISKDVPKIAQCPYDPFGDLPSELRGLFGDRLEGFTAPCARGGTERREVGGGSGFIVSADGFVVTNKHVVADAKAAYTVFTNDGKQYDAAVVARDPLQDLAVLKIAASNLVPARLGNSDGLKLGQTAIAIGNSLGEFKNTVSVGVISGLARTIIASGEGVGVETIRGVIQTDAAVNPGNSGGPLLNLRGEVVGINVAVASNAENIGFAIPVNRALRAIESVKATGSIKAPYLGVRYEMTDEGALVRGTAEGPGVIPSSPAAAAELRTDDIIAAMNGEKLDENNPLGLAIQKYGVGDTVSLTVKRGEVTLTISVMLGERP